MGFVGKPSSSKWALDTFRIVDEDDPTKHKMHTEFYTVPQTTVDAINETHAAGGRVIAVGTTSTRSLEAPGIRRQRRRRRHYSAQSRRHEPLSFCRAAPSM